MPAPKIILYFTPDVKETGRIPISDIKFDASEDFTRGRYQISLKHPCYINGDCTSIKSSVPSTASLTFKSICFGEKSKHVFKVNDYFEIWDVGETGSVDNFFGDWCFFRGIVKQTSSNEQGDSKTYTLNLENAGDWLLGDNAIYYLSQLITIRGQTPTKFFDSIKTKYGWLEGGKETEKGEKLGIDKVKSASELLETLVNGIGNERVNLLKKEFYDNQESIKPIDYETGTNVSQQNVFVADKISEMEGTIFSILAKFEGKPFSEMFIIETYFKSLIIWRNTRWRDSESKLCMGEKAGKPENLVSLYTDPKIKHESSRSFSSQEGTINEKIFSGALPENINRTNDDVINAIFIFPVMWGAKAGVPAIVAEQTAYDQEGAKEILDLNSVIRHGYRPISIELPFIPKYMDAEAFSKSTQSQREDSLNSQKAILGKYLSEHTDFAYSMYKNIQASGNGINVFQNNLHVTIADDFRIVRGKNIKNFFVDEETLWVNVNKITWYLDANEPRTTFEWDRGFEKGIGEVTTDQGFTYV